MLPMLSLRLALGDLLAADANTLAPPTDANVIALISAPFTLNENLVVGDLTLATFDVSTPKAIATGDQQVGLDPATGEQKITILAPAGGFRWEVTTTDDLPQTIYGYALLTDGLAALLAAQTLPTPITLSAVTQFIDLGAVEITFVTQPMS